MQFYLETDITNFFDLSIVLPFYKKLKEFKTVLPRNLKYFQRNGIELIIVLDAPSEEEELKNYLDEFPFANFQIIVNRKDHEWRNPSKALNVGIKAATQKYVFIASPETEYVTDVIYQLRYLLHYHPGTFAIGQIAFLDLNNTSSIEDINNYEMLPYGSIMVEKKYLNEICGYSECITNWGGDDDNIRARLEMLGLRKMFTSQAIAIHREDNSDGHKGRYKKSAEIPVEVYKDIYYPQSLIVNKFSWGMDFNEVAYSWKSRPNKKEQCKCYLRAYKKYWIKNESVFDHEFKIIALIQVKNEIGHLPYVLQHLDKYCDGIILLDDSSTDGSYEAAISEKLLLKVQKESNDIFDDLGLRNITLELASFFNSEWLFFFDADERFDDRFSDLYSIASRDDIDTICFFVVHLWNDKNFYRRDVPEKRDGILPRLRMFRNFGSLKISSNRLLHFPATPFKQKRRQEK
jgi:glycosyltransferase involved in cell wall biosynthesis